MSLIGTLYYLAPEVLDKEKPFSFDSDIYALGATIFHLANFTPPFFVKN